MKERKKITRNWSYTYSQYGRGLKMFVYYNQGNDTFDYFYKNQYGLDSDRFCCVTREFMLAKILEEAKAVGGIRYIEIYL